MDASLLVMRRMIRRDRRARERRISNQSLEVVCTLYPPGSWPYRGVPAAPMHKPADTYVRRSAACARMTAQFSFKLPGAKQLSYKAPLT